MQERENLVTRLKQERTRLQQRKADDAEIRKRLSQERDNWNQMSEARRKEVRALRACRLYVNTAFLQLCMHCFACNTHELNIYEVVAWSSPVITSILLLHVMCMSVAGGSAATA